MLGLTVLNIAIEAVNLYYLYVHAITETQHCALV